MNPEPDRSGRSPTAPKEKIPVGVLGATGAVGQRFVRLLAEHPWFDLRDLAASDRSEGHRYGDVVEWRQASPVPPAAGDLVVRACTAGTDCPIYFSGLDSSVAGDIEEGFARAGHLVLSNARNHRMDDDVPLLVPEVNPDHLDLLPHQRQRRGWDGAIVTNPNCSVVGLAMALAPLHRAFGVDRVVVTTLQAVSGAGYPGPAAIDMLGNVIPRIGGEEEKLESEPAKVLGRLVDDRVEPAELSVSAHTNRVLVEDGHLECVSVGLGSEAGPDEILQEMSCFSGEPQQLGLPSAPERPLVVLREPDRPQPRLDRDRGRGMSVSVGRIRFCPVLDVRFVVLSHNTLRGAAGGAILNAELMVARDLVPR